MDNGKPASRDSPLVELVSEDLARNVPARLGLPRPDRHEQTSAVADLAKGPVSASNHLVSKSAAGSDLANNQDKRGSRNRIQQLRDPASGHSVNLALDSPRSDSNALANLVSLNLDSASRDLPRDRTLLNRTSLNRDLGSVLPNRLSHKIVLPDSRSLRPLDLGLADSVSPSRQLRDRDLHSPV